MNADTIGRVGPSAETVDRYTFLINQLAGIKIDHLSSKGELSILNEGQIKDFVRDALNEWILATPPRDFMYLQSALEWTRENGRS